MQDIFLSRIRRHWQVLLYILGGVLIRVWNIQNSLYFIYDQGRDALVWAKMVHGHFVLVGPTTGLGGFFLGPLWYYLGLPGFVLSRGNPYLLCLWFIGISSLALPLFWWLGHRIFEDKKWAVICAVLLASIPGSIQASIFIWNPLMSVPLMMGVLFAFEKARRSRLWLAAGFLLLALVLQSEFAYGIFFIPIALLLIPWIRRNKPVEVIKDIFIAGLAMSVTLLPQFLFELRNHFIMASSLLKTMHDTSQSVSFPELWTTRPQQLLSTSAELLFGRNPQFNYLVPFTLALFVVGCICAIRQKSPSSFVLKLTAIFAIVPYPFFMLWRGNHGYFFSYYITCHFLFLLPIVLFGLYRVVQLCSFSKLVRFGAVLFAAAYIVGVSAAAYSHWHNTVFAPENNAGLAKMLAAVEEINAWAKLDGVAQPTVRIYTANVYTEQYDYLFGWYAQTHQLPSPNTVRTGQEKEWYVLVESEQSAQAYFFKPWYTEATKGATLMTRHDQVGVLTLESWTKK